MTETHVPQIDALQAADVAQLVQAAAWPSVTLLLDTTPAGRMVARDAERLQHLLDDAERQLTANHVTGSQIRRDLRSLVGEARSGATGRGLVVLVSQAVQRVYLLPAPVTSCAVVEHTFRTRDLVLTLHRTPPYLLLVLHPMSAQLYRGYGDTLVPLTDPGFPAQHALHQLGALAGGEDRLEEFLGRVDRSLRRARLRHPAPIVVAGDRSVVTNFVRRSRNLDRLAGVVTDPALGTVELYAAIRRSFEEYLLSREEEAHLVLEGARSIAPTTVHSGVRACWEAAQSPLLPATLLVEEGLTFPAVVDERGVRRLDYLRAPEVAPPGVHSDLVDDLIEVVIDRGGWVAFTRNGRLAEHGRVALVTVASPTAAPAGVSPAPPPATPGPGTPRP